MEESVWTCWASLIFNVTYFVMSLEIGVFVKRYEKSEIPLERFNASS